MKLTKIVLIIFILVIKTTFAQFNNIEDKLFENGNLNETENPIVLIAKTNFDDYNNFYLTDKGFYELELQQKLGISRELAAEIIKNTSKENWIGWLKDGVSDEEISVLYQLVGVKITSFNTPYFGSLITFMPEMNQHLPESYLLTNNIYMLIDDYSLDNFIMENSNVISFGPYEISFWSEGLALEFIEANDFQLNSLEIVNPQNPLNGIASISPFEASKIGGALHISPDWIHDFSQPNKFPLGFTNLTSEDIKTITAIEIYYSAVGYSFSGNMEKPEIYFDSYLWIPTMYNKHLAAKVKFIDSRDIFVKVRTKFDVNPQDYHIDVSNIKKFRDNSMVPLITSFGGKLIEIAKDAPSNFENLLASNGNWINSENGEYVYGNSKFSISTLVNDILIKENSDGKTKYISILADSLSKTFAYKMAENFVSEVENGLDYKFISETELSVYPKLKYQNTIQKDDGSKTFELSFDLPKNLQNYTEYEQKFGTKFINKLKCTIKAQMIKNSSSLYKVIAVFSN